jgi:Cu/Zn superoxide dismutase
MVAARNPQAKEATMKHQSHRIRRSVAALAAVAAAGGGAFALIPSAHAATAAAAAPKYVFQTLDNQKDPTFNQLLGINSRGVIAGYFGSGADAAHPNKGYQLDPAYGQANYVNENFPGSAQTQVTGIDNKGNTSGFWVNNAGKNTGFVEWNGVFESFTNPKTPHMKGSVNQLLGVNDSGVAVGFYNDAKGNAHAYEVNQATGVFTAIKIPGDVSTTAAGINNLGDIVGFGKDAGGNVSSWLLHNGHLTTYQFPGGSNTTALGINDHDEIVGSYNDAAGDTHGFTLKSPLGPASHWQSIDDPNALNTPGNGTVVNGLNNAGDLVGFYADAAGNVNGMLATPAVTMTRHLTFMPMPQGTASLSFNGAGQLAANLSMFGLTPGSSHNVELVASGGTVLTKFSVLTANGAGQADATLNSTYTGSIPSGSRLVVLDGTSTSIQDVETIAETAALSGPASGLKLTALEVGPGGINHGTPQGTATIVYNPTAQTLTVTVNASNLTSGPHAAHIHLGSCQSQGPVQYMLMDFVPNSKGQIVNQTRVVTNVTTPIPPSGWYLNLHQGSSARILKNGQPTIFFRPLLCSNIS